MQDVEVEPDSLIAQVMRTTSIHTSSGHHQAVKTLGAGLRVVGVASDGIIEALELPGYPWLIAVQWHPEVTAAYDTTQQSLFDALVKQAVATRPAAVAG